MGDNGWYKSAKVEIKFKSYTDNLSGVAAYGLKSDYTKHSDERNKDTDSSGVNFKGYIKDKAGNTATCGPINVKKDSTAPKYSLKLTGTIGDNSWYKSNVKVSFSEHSDAASGVASYGIGSETGNHEVTHSSDGTNFQYTGKIKDKAGNTASCKTSKFKRDATKPSCSTSKSNTWSTSGVNVSISCSDGTSGVATCAGSTSSSSSKSGVTSSKTYTVKDKAGNTASCGVATCTSSCCGSSSYYCNCVTAGGAGGYCPAGYTYVGSSYSSGTCCQVCSSYNTCATSCCGYRSCATSGCGCASFGGWYDVGSCSSGSFVSCRTLYY